MTCIKILTEEGSQGQNIWDKKYLHVFMMMYSTINYIRCFINKNFFSDESHRALTIANQFLQSRVAFECMTKIWVSILAQLCLLHHTVLVKELQAGLIDNSRKFNKLYINNNIHLQILCLSILSLRSCGMSPNQFMVLSHRRSETSCSWLETKYCQLLP